ncbi:MAG: hypothetical protein LBV60_25865 [Streptomyces sp.]|jgi:hypothetical protein|nr:hypothetical protein [Streptomyces sp.]
MHLDDATPPRCTVCGNGLYEHELTARSCRPCTARIDGNLRALAGADGLYARLAGALAPGSSSGGPAVSGSRTAPLPVRLEPLSLAARGGVVTILQTWLIAWHEDLAYSYPRWEGGLQEQLDQVVNRLRLLLPWAAAEHPAVAEFAHEVRMLVAKCRSQVDGERPPRRVPVQCGCGHTLKVTLDTAGIRCPACETQYGHTEALQLPLAERRAA